MTKWSTNQGDNTFEYLHTNHQHSQIYEANIDRTERKRGNNIIVVNFSAPFSIMDFKTHTHTLKIN